MSNKPLRKPRRSGHKQEQRLGGLSKDDGKNMVVRLRLARFGKTNNPVYNIVVAQARSARDKKPIEVIGTYDPKPKPPLTGEEGKPFKDIQLDVARAKYWIGVGAQPSDTVWRLLSMFNILQPQWTIAKKQKGLDDIVRMEKAKKAKLIKDKDEKEPEAQAPRSKKKAAA